MLVAVAALYLAQAPVAASVSDAPLLPAESSLRAKTQALTAESVLAEAMANMDTGDRIERKRTWGAVLFWTGAGILASGMFLIVQSAQGPEPLRPMFGRQAVVTSTAGVALLAGGVGLNISADYDGI